MDAYPSWFSYPPDRPPPDWVPTLIEVVSSSRSELDSREVNGLTSDQALQVLELTRTALCGRCAADPSAAGSRTVQRCGCHRDRCAATTTSTAATPSFQTLRYSMQSQSATERSPPTKPARSDC